MGKGKPQLPGVGGRTDAPGGPGPARSCQSPWECQQEKLRVCCQIFSIKSLPSPGTMSGKQRNLLEAAQLLLSHWGEKHWQLADFFEKVPLRTSPSPPSTLT